MIPDNKKPLAGREGFDNRSYRENYRRVRRARTREAFGWGRFFQARAAMPVSAPATMIAIMKGKLRQFQPFCNCGGMTSAQLNLGRTSA